MKGAGFLVAPSSQEPWLAELPLATALSLRLQPQLQEEENLPFYGPPVQMYYFFLLPNPEGCLYFLPYRVAW